MSILIKGMEMPKTCFKCKFSRITPSFYAWCSLTEKCYDPDDPPPEDCPLIELPPHGRLIDADALENEAQMRLLECNKYDNQFQKPYEVMRAIALAPTIIEAEEGE